MNEETILLKALNIAGKYARDNPPAVLNPDYMDCLIGGKSDIDGYKYIDKWIDQAVKELNEKNV